jgi:hypothetical protein
MKRYSPLVLILVLILLCAAVVSPATEAATATPATPTLTGLHHLTLDDEEEGEEFELEGGEEELELCEASAEEFEFDLEEEAEEEEFELEEDGCGEEETDKKAPNSNFVTAPAACQVRRAESTITTLPATDQVRLTVRYLTYAPTRVIVGLKLKDRIGGVGIEHATKHLGSHGVLQTTTKLGSAVMERAMKATEFDVSLRAPETPGYCADALEQQLHSVKHTGADRPRVYSG